MELRLIVPAEPEWTGNVEILDDRPWKISVALDVSRRLPGYHTISYTWDKGKSPNMFGLPDEISDRTRDALESAIMANSNSFIQAYWIDAVCVPRSGPERFATLESMGLIYSQAITCIVLLERSTWFAVRRQIRGNENTRERDVRIIDSEPWMRSVWTYQEIVNARSVVFTTYNMETPPRMEGNEFFSLTGRILRDTEQDSETSGWKLTSTYPGISTLEDTLADWQVGGWLGMSALTCLTGIAGRWCDPERPANRLYALFGVLTNEAASWGVVGRESVSSLAEEVMRICEDEGDFSFIFTSNERRGRTWRPEPDLEKGMIPLLRWHSWGARQPGTLDDGGGLVLHDMVPLELHQRPSDEAIRVVSYWLRSFCGEDISTVEALQERLPVELSKVGLPVGSICYTSNYGFVLCQEAFQSEDELFICASAALSWTFGGPGMAKVSRQGTFVRCSPIVHVGLHLQNIGARLSLRLW